MSTDFSSIDRLVEFGLGIGLAQQMINTMNSTMNSMKIAGVNSGTPGQCIATTYTSTVQWYAIINGHQAGPLTEFEMKQLMNRGLVSRDTLIWSPGMSGWKLAIDIPEINKLLILK